tara:strand:- start:287 stop:424 length:138 start_codon:yes stop_codon:yes gene_type:complete
LESLTERDKAFPAAQWKLQCIKKLKEVNPEKQQRQYEHLKAVLGL